MAKILKRGANVGVMVRYWINSNLKYGIITLTPSDDALFTHYVVRETDGSLRYLMNEHFTIHRA